MALISLPNDKKISHKRKSPQRALWTISREAFTLPFSFTCLAERKEEEMQELCKVFYFFFDGLPLQKTNFFNWFVSHLPMMAWQADSLPGSLSIFFLTKSLFKQTEIALFDGIKQFLLGSRDIRMLKFSHQDFAIDPFSTARFAAGEIKFLVETPQGVKFAEKSLPFFKETCLKCFRSYQSVLNYDSRKFHYYNIEQIKTDLAHFCLRCPHFFEDDIFDSFSLFSALITKKFREKRPSMLLRRIFLSLYFVKRQLMEILQAAHYKKSLAKLRIFPIGREDHAIGVATAVHLTSKYEYFGEDELLLATQKGFPNIRPVYQSFCPFSKQGDAIQTFYLELKKEDGHPFLKKEISFLRNTLPTEITKKIERLSPRTFGTCFEEDIMKNTTVLMREVESFPSCPHMMIFFDRVEAEKLFFTLLLVRQKKKKEKSLEMLLKKTDPIFLFILDRVTIIGETEVNVFHIQLTKTPDLMRSDGAVHFALARKKIAALLESRVGEIRDYNGGLLEKKEENVTALKKTFPKVEGELIDTFFHSLYPVVMQATLTTELLCHFFRLFLGCSEKSQKTLSFFDEGKDFLFAHISSDLDDFVAFLKNQSFPSSFESLALVCISLHGTYHISFFLIYAHRQIKELFKKTLLDICARWKKEKGKICLRISSEAKAPLDPRRGGDRNTTTILRVLFDGLTRFDEKGKPTLALAKSYTLSSDQKTCTFTLRRSYWSNGDPVTAYDFEYAWKTALTPSFPVDFPELFYCIKNAEEAKRGKTPLSKVGIKAKNRHTLIIDLEYPTPDFLERLAHTLFYPVPSQVVTKDSQWAEQRGENFVSNGPFCLENPTTGMNLSLKKSNRSFRKKTVKIDHISVVQSSTSDALRLFKEGKLDFVEIPNRAEGEFAVKETDVGSVSFPAPKISWFAINTTSFPLHNLHFRKALAASVNRNKLKNIFPCEKKSAFTLLPCHLTEHKEADFLIHYNPERARIYFHAATLELRLTKDNFPPISLMVPNNKRKKSIAKSLKEEWESVLGISCLIESCPWREFYTRRVAKDFQLAMVEWGAPTSDPLSTLLAFKTKTNKLNLSNFEHPEYKKLLNQALRETHPEKRKALAAKLEEMLIRAVCVLPTFYERFWFFKKPNVKISAVTSSFNAMPDFSYFSLK